MASYCNGKTEFARLVEVLEGFRLDGIDCCYDEPSVVAKHWLACRFNSEQTTAWLRAGCLTPSSAATLRVAGIEAQGLHNADGPNKAYTSRLGYMFSNGDLSVRALESALSMKCPA